MEKSIWLTWEDHRRSRELSNALSAKYICLTHPGGRYIRYSVLAVATLWHLIKERADVVYCQNPSIILNTLLCTLKPFFKYKLICDRHSNFKFITSESRELKWKIFHRLSKYTIKKSDLTIVTNNFLKNYIDNSGGRGFVLQDKLPTLTNGQEIKLLGKKNYVFICSYSADEPVQEVIKAADKLKDEVHVYITGSFKKYNRINEIHKNKPDNITLTGFLSEKDYQDLVLSADALIILTSQEHTLTCGAYEAVALGKPMILGDTEAIKNYFSKGALYSDLTVNNLEEKMVLASNSLPIMKKNVISLKAELTSDWNRRFSDLKKTIEILPN